MSSLSHTDIARGFVSQLDKKSTKTATKQLAALIVENRIHGQTEEILSSIQTEYQRVHGIVEATTTSVHPLSDSLQKEVRAIVLKRTKAKQVILHQQLDSSVLGGVKISAPEMELDLTLKAKLTKLKA